MSENLCEALLNCNNCKHVAVCMHTADVTKALAIAKNALGNSSLLHKLPGRLTYSVECPHYMKERD